MPRNAGLIARVIVPAIAAGALVCAPVAGAAAPPPMTVTVQSPSGATNSYFEVSAHPGQVTPAGSLNLRNQSGKQVTVMLDPVRGLTASTLGSAYGLRGTKAVGPAGWVVLGQRRVVLAPHAGARVPVSVRVPTSAKAGDYLAGIGVQAAGGANQTELKGNVAISNVQRYAVGLVTTLPGPRHPQIRLTGVKLERQPAGVTFSIQGRNSGNVILQNVKGAATVSDGDDVVARRTLGPGTFVTGTSIAYPLLVPSLHPKQGASFRVQAFLRYDGGIARIDKVVSFGEIDAQRQQDYGGPPVDNGGGGNHLLLILLIVLVVAGCLAALEVRRRRLGKRAVRPALQRAIAHARAADEPLSVILVASDSQPSSKLSATVRSCLRRNDGLFRPNGSGLLVIAPDTTPAAGEMLAAEIKRHLGRENGGSAVIPVTSAAESSAEELLEAVSAAAPAGAENGAARSEVKQSGQEAPAVGSHDATQHPR